MVADDFVLSGDLVVRILLLYSQGYCFPPLCAAMQLPAGVKYSSVPPTLHARITAFLDLAVNSVSCSCMLWC